MHPRIVRMTLVVLTVLLLLIVAGCGDGNY
jgi:hypothetical protein